MSSRIAVYDPVAPCLTQPQQLRRTLGAISGKVIGFIDNSKPNFNYLVDDVSQFLLEKHFVASVVKRRKRSASEGAPEAMMRELVEQTDAVITGSGD
jgi:hypothetical protein